LEPIWQEFFDCEPLDENRTYDQQSTVFWTKYNNTNGWYHAYRELNFKIIIDHLWDNPVDVVSYRKDNVFTLQAGNWIWYNESLWYQSLGYHQYQRRPTNEKLFLMLMRRKKRHRDMILSKMQPFLADCLYSYVEENIFLEDDLLPDSASFQRHLNTKWYDSTAFSMCVETGIGKIGMMSEKSFKPMAFQHAFVIWGEAHTLKRLRNLGFETFGHCIDESYDDVSEDETRLECVYQVINYLFPRWKNNIDLF
jgi:hypothetical protein